MRAFRPILPLAVTVSRRSLFGAPLALVPLRLALGATATPVDEWRVIAEDVRSEMAWAWKNYVELAFGKDQIKPVSGGAEPFLLKNGPSLGLTIVEALDTLYLMHLDAELEEAVRWIEKNLHFDLDGE